MKGSRDSLKTLRIFQNAARTLNFSRSAEEMNMTQSAVSKHINALEARLGTALFLRKNAGLALTYTGARYLKRIDAALSLIDEADSIVTHTGARQTLNVAVSPSFAQFCLIPGLPSFVQQHPNIRLNIRPRLLFTHEECERFDAAIQLHTGHAGGMALNYLCGKEMSLVASPALLNRSPITNTGHLPTTTVLKRAQRGYSWDEWKAQIAPDWPGPTESSPEFEGFTLLLPAVFNGLGAAIVPICMVLDRIENGELVRPLNEVATSRYGYYLMRPKPHAGSPALDAFVEWLNDHVADLQHRQSRYLQAHTSG